MIKKKILNIKIIFKTYLKILNIGYKYFKFPNRLYFIKHQKMIFKNRSLKLFFWNYFLLSNMFLIFFIKKYTSIKTQKKGYINI